MQLYYVGTNSIWTSVCLYVQNNLGVSVPPRLLGHWYTEQWNSGTLEHQGTGIPEYWDRRTYHLTNKLKFSIFWAFSVRMSLIETVDNLIPPLFSFSPQCDLTNSTIFLYYSNMFIRKLQLMLQWKNKKWNFQLNNCTSLASRNFDSSSIVSSKDWEIVFRTKLSTWNKNIRQHWLNYK